MVIVINGVNGRMGKMLYDYYKDKFDIIGVDTKVGGFSSFTNIQGINRKIDLVIDFSSTSALKELEYALENGIKVISGTTGYEQKELDMLKKLGNGIFYHSSNYAKGIKIFTKVLKQIRNEYESFDIVETHSSKKKDAPSGTAKMLANELEFESNKIQSLRLKDSNPIHEVIFTNENEKIKISHEITNSKAFIEGFDEVLKQLMM